MRGSKQITQYAEAIRRVVNAEKNAAKGSWLALSSLRLLWLLLKEYFELVGAVWKYEKARAEFAENPTIGNHSALMEARRAVASESADCGAVGMMISDKCGAL